ncbi:oxygen-independent coproporphyrinogen-3 oxidase [Natranaerovirga pectinivora]|uniref:Oxygen-independent coproporphyrinogen-3 oxidase n=1 Tax=Natranaerovirga pectinivora TaxID=682400 RepID=A0A4R3MNF1_9FIRM|nr:coproporphyrinogen dehydrogenase HemZ [Natranaerovirga pectinivora]TCT16785.1 oxygen-independent coproporphyrinogen-3 oxidase [Natranaerovirga pectinivora]
MNLNIKGIDNTYDIEMLLSAFYPLDKIIKNQETHSDTLCVDIEVEDKITISITENKIEVYKTSLLQEEDFKNTKLKIKRVLFNALTNMTKKELPWGTLTGIRPVKIAMDLIKKEKNEEAIKTILNEKYLLSDEKMNLMMEIAKEELKVLNKYTEDDYSVYIGIPFCPTKCLYCSFTSFSMNKYEDLSDKYLDALEKEIEYTSYKFKDKRLRTIYIGGGTPTALSERQLSRLIKMVEKYFNLTDLDEYTVEAGRPDSITREKLEILKNKNITRISINPQTMNQKTLDTIGRSHSIEAVIEVYNQARALGFNNINMDVILGLPNETVEEVKKTFDYVKEMKPDSLTVHTLAIKRGSKLNIKTNNYEDVATKEANEMQKISSDAAKDLDLIPYYLYRQKNIVGNLENIGYAKENKLCIYNILIMEEAQTIIALGAGAISKIIFPNNRIERIENVKNVTDYIDRIDDMINRKELFFKKEESR